MARIRTIKPEFWTSEQIVECSITSRLLFIGLWNFADDNGIHPDSAKRIKMQVFPADNLSCEEIAELVEELVAVGLLRRYTANDRSYLHITGWADHQKIQKPFGKYPVPDWLRTSPIPVCDQSYTSPIPVPPGTETERNGTEIERKYTTYVRKGRSAEDFENLKPRMEALKQAIDANPSKPLADKDRELCVKAVLIESEGLVDLEPLMASCKHAKPKTGTRWGYFRGALKRACEEAGHDFYQLFRSLEIPP